MKINLQGGGNKKWTTKTAFAKMYITAFPLRATVVFDDCTDVGVFYDASLPRIVALNREPEVQDKVLLIIRACIFCFGFGFAYVHFICV